MIIGYSLTFAISLITFALFLCLIKNKEFWLCMVFVCISLVNLGYLMLSLANTLTFAIISNDVAYLGSVFLLIFMFLTIVKLCGFNVKKRTGIILIFIGFAMFLIVATSGILPWYYKSVRIEQAEGATKLVKEYGVLHPVYLVYLIAYFVGMVGSIVHSIATKKGQSQKIAFFLSFIVFINIAIWFIEKFSRWEFEFLSVSYIVSEVLFILLYWLIQDYVHHTNVPKFTEREEEMLGVAITSMSMQEKLNKVLSFVKDGDSLAVREREILEYILKNKKRKDIATELMLSENTVKTYTRTLYSKLGVSSRSELYDLILKEN